VSGAISHYAPILKLDEPGFVQRAVAHEVYGRSLLIQIHGTTSKLPRLLFGKIPQEVPLDVLPDPPNLLAGRDAAASALV